MASMTLQDPDCQAEGKTSLAVPLVSLPVSHAARLAISRTLEDDILHRAAAQVFDPLFAEDPGYCIRDIAFAAAIRPDNGSNAVTCEENLGVVREGFETGNLEAFQFEHARNRL